MAKIDEVIEKIKDNLVGKEIEISELDNMVKVMLKAKNSLFTNVQNWVINNSSDEVKISYGYHLPNEHLAYVTFVVCKNKSDKLLRDMNVIVTEIERL